MALHWRKQPIKYHDKMLISPRFIQKAVTSSYTHTNNGYLGHFVHSDNQFVFTLTFKLIINERSRRAALQSLDYDVNIEKQKKFQKGISSRGIFAPTDHTYKTLAEKSRDFKVSDCQSMATWIIFADQSGR